MSAEFLKLSTIEPELCDSFRGQRSDLAAPGVVGVAGCGGRGRRGGRGVGEAGVGVRPDLGTLHLEV